MDDFMKLLLETFAEEARETVEALEKALLALERSESPTAREEHYAVLARRAHNLKGAAGAAGVTEIQSLSHALEDGLLALRDTHGLPQPEMFDVLYAGVDAIRMISSGEEALKPSTESLRSLEAALRSILNPSSDFGSLSPPTPPPAVPTPPKPAPIVAAPAPPPPKPAAAAPAPPRTPPPAPPQTPTTTTPTTAKPTTPTNPPTKAHPRPLLPWFPSQQPHNPPAISLHPRLRPLSLHPHPHHLPRRLLHLPSRVLAAASRRPPKTSPIPPFSTTQRKRARPPRPILPPIPSRRRACAPKRLPRSHKRSATNSATNSATKPSACRLISLMR